MGIETMYSVNVSQVATVSFEGVISDIGSKDPLSFATVQLLHGDEVHSVLSKDNGVFSFPSVHPGDYILRITYVGYAQLYGIDLSHRRGLGYIPRKQLQ